MMTVMIEELDLVTGGELVADFFFARSLVVVNLPPQQLPKWRNRGRLHYTT